VIESDSAQQAFAQAYVRAVNRYFGR
jgi:hypothetical protein